MFIKDSLRHKDTGRIRNVCAVLVVTAMLTALLTGCGTKAATLDEATDTAQIRHGGADIAEKPTEQAGTDEAPEKAPDTELADGARAEGSLMYATAEERQRQPKPDYDIAVRSYEEIYLGESSDSTEQTTYRELWGSSNKFFMVDEVMNDEHEYLQDEDICIDYLRLKGTLYEVYHNDEPEYNFVYFPGDEVPEGYEVRTTENYEMAIADNERLGEGHSHQSAMFFKKAQDTNGKIASEVSYRIYGNGSTRIMHFSPGMYMEVTTDDTGRYILYQYLTKEDMEELPDGAEFVESYGKPSLKVAHY